MKDPNEKKITDDVKSSHDQVSEPVARRNSFVMTLWLEGAEDTAVPQWRWRVVDARQHQQIYFSELADLLAYVSEQAGVPPPC